MTPGELERFRAGDERVMTELVRQHSPRLLAVAVRITGDRDRAHDLVQNAWIRAYERRMTFGGSGSFVGWMLAILQSGFLREHRDESRRHAKMEAIQHDTISSHDPINALTDHLDAETVQRRLLDGLAQLTERQRDVVAMRIIEGRSVSETAEALGVADGTVKATLSQALERLRSIIPGRHE
jgi:RNA polymerase sigma-70 factor (ECF subfamily)